MPPTDPPPLPPLPGGVSVGVAGALLHRWRVELGIGDAAIRAVRIATIGRGESHLNLKLDADLSTDLAAPSDRRRTVVLRLSHRFDGAETLHREFAALERAPAGLAPRVYALDDAVDLLPRPGLLLEWVPGTSTAGWTAGDWTPARLRAHAAGLARIHARTSERWGDVRPTRRAPMRMSALFDEALAWWRDNHPEATAIPRVARLLPRVRSQLAASDASFEALARFAFRHGDACAPNLLVDGPPAAPTVRYVDWEWAGYGDPAHDLAHLFWPLDVPPWQVALPDAALEVFLAAYEAARLRLEPDAPADPGLRARREAWIGYLMFFDHLHMRTRLEAGEPYRSALAALERGLAARFG